MPSQEDLDIENKNSLSNQRANRSRRSDARATKDKMNAALRGATSTKERREIKKEFRVDTNKASDQTDNQQGANEDSNQRGGDDFKPKFNNVENDGSGGSGLPDFPTSNPLLPDFKGILSWSVADGAALWLQGTPVAPTEETPYLDVMVYDPASTVDNFSLTRTEFLEVIICKDGEPVTGNIFFAEATIQP